jgi:hypothetical protein
MIIKAGLLYFAAVFAVAFLMGVLRVTVIAPRVGELGAVALEVPLILGLSWFVAGRLLQRWPLDLPGRIAMGGFAFVVLMLAEFALATFLFGQTTADYLAAFAKPAGGLGLAGQIAFAVIPALRPQAKG